MPAHRLCGEVHITVAGIVPLVGCPVWQHLPCLGAVQHRAIRCTEQLRRYWNFESVGVGYLFNFEVEDRWL